MEPSSDRASGRPWVALLGLLAAAGAGALILVGYPLPAGLVTLVAAACFIVADVRSEERRGRFGTAVAARLADGIVLGPVAWVSVDAAPVLAAAALAAMGSAYLAAYVRAKAGGLGFRLDRLFPRDGLHFVLVGLGLLVMPLLQVTLWLAAAVSLLSVARDAGQVARQQELR